jgi:hypothetical protein
MDPGKHFGPEQKRAHGPPGVKTRSGILSPSLSPTGGSRLSDSSSPEITPSLTGTETAGVTPSPAHSARLIAIKTRPIKAPRGPPSTPFLLPTRDAAKAMQ